MNSVAGVLVLILSISVSSVYLNPVEDGNNGRIGCLKCHNIDKNKINVHLVPHSHDDVGWLKTLDQYYYGLNNTIQRASVQYIITSVVEALTANPDRRFIQVETAFFWKWWQEQSESMRKAFTNLVDNGQIEMVNGAWSMNDEACTNYQSTIDQFTWGLRLINETVGSCGKPRVGWQIDPFGHSREQASIFTQLGYDGVFFSRLDHDDRDKREKTKSLEFAWQTSANLPNIPLFGGIFPTEIYYPPDGFCWDYECEDDAIDDNVKSADYNLDQKVKIFSELMQKYLKFYETKNLLIPMGGDFHYAAAEANFINMDKLIKAFDNNTNINVFYSTPSCYIKAVQDFKPTLNLKTDDFFPYSNDEHSFWTGYFSSRPTIKRFERVGHNILQAMKQLYSLSTPVSKQNREQHLTELREVMGTFQHHDAVTGTEKQHVAKDYVRHLTRAIETAEKPVGEIIRDLTSQQNLSLDMSSCLLSNISICVSQELDRFIVLVYNPLAWPVTHYVRLPVNTLDLRVMGPGGAQQCDIVPTFSEFDNVQLPQKPSLHELVFTASGIPPLGFKIYYVEKTNGTKCKQVVQSDMFTFGSNKTSFTIDSSNRLQSVTINGKTVNITQHFLYYNSKSAEKADTKNFVNSGAYLFRPNSSSADEVAPQVTKLGAFSGDVVDEFHQEWTSDFGFVRQSIRVYKKESYIEFDWIIGNITIGDNVTGKEVISRFSVTEDFDNNDVFYTDSNGREMLKRTLNRRSDYEYDSKVEPVASNYYPVTSRIVIKDEKKDLEIAVLNDRSQGGTSLRKGEIELMVHRRLFRDDHKGVDECLNETEFSSGLYVRGSHYLVLGKASGRNGNAISTAAQERLLAHEKLLQPWVGVSPTNATYDQLKTVTDKLYAPLVDGKIPSGVNILTLEPWTEGTHILRLEHILEKDEDPELSVAQQVDLSNLFRNFKITDIQETTLSANEKLEDFKRREKYTWATNGTAIPVPQQQTDKNEYKVLNPMQIRTFIIKIQQKTGSFGNTTYPAFSLILSLLLINLFCH